MKTLAPPPCCADPDTDRVTPTGRGRLRGGADTAPASRTLVGTAARKAGEEPCQRVHRFWYDLRPCDVSAASAQTAPFALPASWAGLSWRRAFGRRLRGS